MAQRASKKWSRPELVLCSPAKRAIQTYEFFKEKWWKEADNKICSELYEGSPSIILDLLSRVAEEIHSVVAVFHNPNITILTNLLAQQRISNSHCGVVTLQFQEIQWRKLEVGSCLWKITTIPKGVKIGEYFRNSLNGSSKAYHIKSGIGSSSGIAISLSTKRATCTPKFLVLPPFLKGIRSVQNSNQHTMGLVEDFFRKSFICITIKNFARYELK